MRSAAAVLILALAWVVSCAAQSYPSVSLWCEKGNVTVTINSGLSSTQKFQQSYPQCTIDVYLTGTNTHASIYSTASGTGKGNPFTALASGLATFFVTAGVYDIRLSSAGISSPFTIPSVNVPDTGSRSSVTPQMFGAKCDGSANDTAAFAAAIASLPAHGGTMNVPPGVCITSIVFPQYPKYVKILCSGQDATILQPPSANTPILSWPSIIANDVSSPDELGNCSVKAHASGSTGPAIDMRGSDTAYIHDISFLSNGSANFAEGFRCDDQTAGKTACYFNTIERIKQWNQSGPTILFNFQGGAAGNSIRDVSSASNSGSATNLIIAGTGATENTFESIRCDGNSGMTCVEPGSYNTFITLQCWDVNLACVAGNGGGNDTFINITSQVPVVGQISCASAEPGWKFINPQMVNASYLLAYPQSGCVNISPEYGGLIFGSNTGTSYGGYSASPVNGPGFQSCLGVGGITSTLTAGTYSYAATTTNAAGETTASGSVSCTITDGQAVLFILTPFPGDAHYKMYGRHCPTNATCKLLAEQDVASSGSQGLNVYDMGQAPTGNPPPVRNQSGDVNGDYFARWNNHGPYNEVAECLTNTDVTHCPTLSINNAIAACENGLTTTGTATVCNANTPGYHAWPWADGYEVQMYTTHSLATGAGNTFSLENNISSIVSCWNSANGLGTAIAAGTRVKFMWLAGGASPLNKWCVEGQ